MRAVAERVIVRLGEIVIILKNPGFPVGGGNEGKKMASVPFLTPCDSGDQKLAHWKIWGDVPREIQMELPPTQVHKRIQFSAPELFKDRDFLHQKYVIERHSTSEIAALVSSSRTTVMKYLKLHGIPIRESGKNLRLVRSVGFGKRITKQGVVTSNKEMALVGKMQSLRAEGLSYWKIADVFNAWGIPTKTKKGKWSSKTIHEILKRMETLGSEINEKSN